MKNKLFAVPHAFDRQRAVEQREPERIDSFWAGAADDLEIFSRARRVSVAACSS